MHKGRLAAVVLDCQGKDSERDAAFWGERLGAKHIAQARAWWVIETPSGHRFGVVRPQRVNFDTQAKTWA